MKNLLFLLLPVLFFAAGCTPDTTDDDNAVDFDRQEMLAGWVDNVIVPAHADLGDGLAALVAATNAAPTDGSNVNLPELRAAFVRAYEDYQRLDPVLAGDAERLQIREHFNTYPTDVALIEDNITSAEGVNLSLPSNFAAQGFPALDYLLYGVDASVYAGEQANLYRNYLVQIVVLMTELNGAAANFWTAANRADFIANDGNSATASIDRTVNDYIFHYEKFLRAGKVGIPAGIFSNDPLADRVEGPYSGISNQLFLASLAASEDFFTNHGLADYLDALNVEREGETLSGQIIAQFNVAENTARAIDLPFGEQVTTDNVKMLELYNELQRNTILLKVDMLQALSINVDYVDADGD